MKYVVDFSCGHSEQVELFGKTADRERKIAYLEKNCVCSACKAEQKNIENSIGCEEVTMSYREYKTEYPNCKTVQGSYNGTDKTITVYVPNNR